MGHESAIEREQVKLQSFTHTNTPGTLLALFFVCVCVRTRVLVADVWFKKTVLILCDCRGKEL